MEDIFDQLSAHPMIAGGIGVAAGGAILAWLRRVPGLAMSAIRRRLISTVEISDRDMCYPWFQEWLSKRPEVERSRDRIAKTQWGNYQPSFGQSVPNAYASGPVKAETPRILMVPGPGTRVIRWRGRPVVATYVRQQIVQNGSPTGWLESITLRFLGARPGAIEAMLAEVAEIGTEKSSGVPIYTPIGDSWASEAILPRRAPDSLALADGLLPDIFADLRRFLDSGQWYADRGIPHRRGYLLHGPPGTGKTTLAPVVAGELGLGIATLSLGDPNFSDVMLRLLFRNLGPNMILVIEDIDCIFAGRQAAGEKVGVTLSGLLNVLDGIGSKEGRILFMTTNHPERLDPALIRPGRIDRRIELGYATADQARRMFAWFFKGHAGGDDRVARLADAFAAKLPTGTAPAAIQEHLLRHRDDPAEAARAFGEGPTEMRPIEMPTPRAALNGHARHA